MKNPGATYLGQLIIQAGKLIGLLLPITVGIALLVFFWGLARFALSAGDEHKREEGKNRMIWGIITLFIMVSVWGAVYTVRVLFGLSSAPTVVGPAPDPCAGLVHPFGTDCANPQPGF